MTEMLMRSETRILSGGPQLRQWTNMLISLVPLIMTLLLIGLKPNTFYVPGILIGFLIHKPHRKRLQTLMYSTVTCQWIPFNCYVKTCRPWYYKHIGHWATILLGASFSSDTMSDGARSEAAKLRRSKLKRQAYHSKTHKHRELQQLARMGIATAAPVMSLPPEHQLTGTKTRPKLHIPSAVQEPSATVFYQKHKGGNKWLQLQRGHNITGSSEEFGIHARCNIPTGTKLAPYLGTKCSGKTTGRYCIKVLSDDDSTTHLDACHIKYDVGYSFPLSTYHQERMKGEPNYARYANSLTPAQITAGGTFNAMFQSDDLEDFPWLYSITDIPFGDEILVDYGVAYWEGTPRKGSKQLQARTRQSALTQTGRTSRLEPMNGDTEDIHSPPPITSVPPVTRPSVSNILFGNAFSSDNSGDGPRLTLGNKWIRCVYYEEDTNYEVTLDDATLSNPCAGITINTADISLLPHGTTDIGLALETLPLRVMTLSAHTGDAWPLELHALHTLFHGGASTPFAARVLIPALLPYRGIPIVYATIEMLQHTPLQEVGWHALPIDCTYAVLDAMALPIHYWEAIGNGWHRTTATSTFPEVLRLVTSKIHITIDQGIIRRLHPNADHILAIANKAKQAIARSYEYVPEPEPAVHLCAHHMRTNMRPTLPLGEEDDWWTHQLTQHVNIPYAIDHRDICLFHQNASVRIKRTDLLRMHRQHATTPGITHADLTASLMVTVASRIMPTPWQTGNSLTASFLAFGYNMQWVNETQDGRRTLRAFLINKLEPLMLGATQLTAARRIINDTLDDLHRPLPLDDEILALRLLEVSEYMAEWQTWTTCCHYGKWLYPGPLGSVPERKTIAAHKLMGTTGLTIDNNYHPPPTIKSILLLLELLERGLRAALQHSPITPMLIPTSPTWKFTTLPTDKHSAREWKWNNPRWIHRLPAGIQCDVNDTIRLWHGNAFISIDPWAAEAATHESGTGTLAVGWLETHLLLDDIGYVAIHDPPPQEASFADMGILSPHTALLALKRTSSFLDQRRETRTRRYLKLAPTKDAQDVDVDITAHLILGSNRPIGIWTDGPIRTLYARSSPYPLTVEEWVLLDQDQHFTVTDLGGLSQITPPIQAINYIIVAIVQALATQITQQRQLRTAVSPWMKIDPLVSTSCFPDQSIRSTLEGTEFSEKHVRMILLGDSPLFEQQSTYRLLAQTSLNCHIRIVMNRDNPPITLLPTAFLIIYQIYTGKIGNGLLQTTAGRHDLLVFLMQVILPRLQYLPGKDTCQCDPAEEKLATQSYKYLRRIATWLLASVGTPWTGRIIPPTTFMYILQEDPNIVLWTGRPKEMIMTPYHRQQHTAFPLAELDQYMRARWHIVEYRGEYTRIQPPVATIHLLGNNMMQLLRLTNSTLPCQPMMLLAHDRNMIQKLEIPLNPMPLTRLVSPDPLLPRYLGLLRSSNYLIIEQIHQHICLRQEEHGVSVPIGDLTAYLDGKQITDRMIHFWYKPTLLEKSVTQHDGYSFFQTMAQFDSPLHNPLNTKDKKKFIAHIQAHYRQTAIAGGLTATLNKLLVTLRNSLQYPEDCWMSKSEIETLVAGQATPTLLWTGVDNWMTLDQRNGTFQRNSTHIGLEGLKYLPLHPNLSTLDLLAQELISRIRTLDRGTKAPMQSPYKNTGGGPRGGMIHLINDQLTQIHSAQLDIGSVLVRQTCGRWSMVLTGTQRAILRQRDVPTVDDDTPVALLWRCATHLWTITESEGYCGYESLHRQRMYELDNDIEPFTYRDASHRGQLQNFLRSLLQLLHHSTSDETIARMSGAIAHLDSSCPLPPEYWCTVELILQLADHSDHQFWAPLAQNWLSTRPRPQRNRPPSLDIAYDGNGHFSTLLVSISEDDRRAAYDVLQQALRGGPTPTGWEVIEGTLHTDHPFYSSRRIYLDTQPNRLDETRVNYQGVHPVVTAHVDTRVADTRTHGCARTHSDIRKEPIDSGQNSKYTSWLQHLHYEDGLTYYVTDTDIHLKLDEDSVILPRSALGSIFRGTQHLTDMSFWLQMHIPITGDGWPVVLRDLYVLSNPGGRTEYWRIVMHTLRGMQHLPTVRATVRLLLDDSRDHRTEWPMLPITCYRHLFTALQIPIKVWTTLDGTCCRMDTMATSNTLDTCLSGFHLFINEHQLTAFPPRIEALRGIIHQLCEAVDYNGNVREPFPSRTHTTEIPKTPATPQAVRWWQQMLLQYLDNMISDISDTSISLYYQNIQLTITRTEMVNLHREFLTNPGSSVATIVGTMKISLSIWHRNLLHSSKNPFHAIYLGSGLQRANALDNEVAYRSFLTTAMRPMLQDATIAPRIGTLIDRLVLSPDSTLGMDSDLGARFLKQSNSHLTSWKALTSSWALLQPPIAPHCYTLDYIQRMGHKGIVYDGIMYYELRTPTHLHNFVGRIQYKLQQSLRSHPLAALTSSVPPEWKYLDAQIWHDDTRWNSQHWTSLLPLDIDYTGEQQFHYKNVTVTFHPWMTVAALMQCTLPGPIQSQLAQSLVITNIGLYDDFPTILVKNVGDCLNIASMLGQTSPRWRDMGTACAASLQLMKTWDRLNRYLQLHPHRHDDTFADADGDILELLAQDQRVTLWTSHHGCDKIEGYSILRNLTKTPFTPVSWQLIKHNEHWGIGRILTRIQPPTEHIDYIIDEVISAIAKHTSLPHRFTNPYVSWPPFLPLEIDRLRTMVSDNFQLMYGVDGLRIQLRESSVTILHSSPIFSRPARCHELLTRSEEWILVKADIPSGTPPKAPLSAFLVLYKIHMGTDGDHKLTSAAGRLDLRRFILQTIMPRLRLPMDWEDALDIDLDEPEDREDTHVTLQAYQYLKRLVRWLLLPPFTPWTQGSIEPITFSYLVQDDPGVVIWESDNPRNLQLQPWPKYPSTSETTLKHFYICLAARWHVGYKTNTYSILPVNRHDLHMLGTIGAQLVRQARIHLNDTPRITNPGRVADASSRRNTGGGSTPLDISTIEHIILTLDGHTLLIDRLDLALLPDWAGVDSPEARRQLMAQLPIRYSCSPTNKERMATPGGGYCSLFALSRLQDTSMRSTSHQSSRITALPDVINDIMRTLPEDPGDTQTPARTRESLSLLSQHLLLGHSRVPMDVWLPLDCMQHIVRHHRTPVTLWESDWGGHSTVFVSTTTGTEQPLTMNSLTQLAVGRHLAFSQQHFFEIAVNINAIDALIQSTMLVLTHSGDHPPLIDASDIDEGAVFVRRTNSDWGIAVSSNQIRRRCLGDIQSFSITNALTTVHCYNRDTLWAAIASNGYCGYLSLLKQHESLNPPDIPFDLRNQMHRKKLQTFVQQLADSLPSHESFDDCRRRMAEAVTHLDHSTPLPYRAWCHIDLVLHTTSQRGGIFWQPAASPIHTVNWLGSHRRDNHLPHAGLDVAFNGVNHFSVLAVPLTQQDRTEVHQILELAVRSDPLPAGWESVRGTRRVNGEIAIIENHVPPCPTPTQTQNTPCQIPSSDVGWTLVTPKRTKRTMPDAITPMPRDCPKIRLAKPNPILTLFYHPPPATTEATQDLRASAQNCLALFQELPTLIVPPMIRDRRPGTLKSYVSQLEFRTTVPKFKPNVSVPPPPRSLLDDDSAVEGTLYQAPSRLGHHLMGTYAMIMLPLAKKMRKLCEYRSEKGNQMHDHLDHGVYLAQLDDNRDVIVRGNILVDGGGNTHSFCTSIQENLSTLHFNCEYRKIKDKIWIVQTAEIQANEELSIQYSPTGDFWRNRTDYPWELTHLACLRYGLPVPLKPEPILLPKIAHQLVKGLLSSTTEEIMSPDYYHKWPFPMPSCSMRVGTLNVNGALHDMTLLSAQTLARLMDAAQLSILGITDARIPLDRCDAIKRQLHQALPHGMAIIPFGTKRPIHGSDRTITMGGQLILIHKQWEPWVGHHRMDSSGLALIVSIRISYNRSALTIIQVMVPPRSQGPYTMWTRLKEYLLTTHRQLSPADYVLSTAESWATEERLAGRGVLVMGDFNRRVPFMTEWAALNGLRTLSKHLLSTRITGFPFSSYRGTRTSPPSLIDHILLLCSHGFDISSIGGSMHELFATLTDHYPHWIGIDWPETPPPIPLYRVSPRITNSPDLPEDATTRDIFAATLDAVVHKLMLRYPLTSLTPNLAGRVQAMVIAASVQVARSLATRKPLRKAGRGHKFKDGFSPAFMLLKEALQTYVGITRLVWKHASGGRTRREASLARLLVKWNCNKLKYVEHIQSYMTGLFPRGTTLAAFHIQDIAAKISAIRLHLHGRYRRQMRMAISKYSKNLEDLLTARKLKRLIQKLLPSPSDPLNFEQLSRPDGQLFSTPEEADRAAAKTMQDWMAVPPDLNPIAQSFEIDPAKWTTLLDGTATVTRDAIPQHIQERIHQAARKRPISIEATQELHEAMHSPITFGEFERYRKALTEGKSPGPSGNTTTQAKYWGPLTTKYVYDLSAMLWASHTVPDWWQDRLMTLLPKENGVHDLNKIRPISLFEIIRKLWAGIVAKRVHRTLQKHNILHPNQHGFRAQHGTHTAVLHVLNKLEVVGHTVPLHLTFWDIRRAFDSVPKWLQRLAWARLGLAVPDLEWFLQLDSIGRIMIRTPHQQDTTTHSTVSSLRAGGPMLTPQGSSFHPGRGIGQGDTPSTLVFIAVFDILLTLLDDSDTGEAHAYADDLAHAAPTLLAQQIQADLMCGFCAFTGIEVSVKKVEAISINYGNILHDTPFLRLHDWVWREYTVQHHDDGFWTRYLGLYLDTNSCEKHFHRAKIKFAEICHTLLRKFAPPDAKRLVYILCIMSQIRYPAGLAPWTLKQYKQLDSAPTTLLRHIYGLRLTFPTSLIYAPLDVGGCGESRISDIAQLQKWNYLHSVAHLNQASTRVMSDLISRACDASVMDSSYYCSSLVEWGSSMGLVLYRAPSATMPDSLLSFLAEVRRRGPSTVYTDGSFAIHGAPLLDSLTDSRPDLTRLYGKATTGIYIPARGGECAMGLHLYSSPAQASDAFYQELLGIAVGLLLSNTVPIIAYSDCQSAIRRFRQACNPLGAVIGHLKQGPLLQGIRMLAYDSHDHTLHWTKAHPERTKDTKDWTTEDWGIHMADKIAGLARDDLKGDPLLPLYHCSADEVLAALITPDTWMWGRVQADSSMIPITESLPQLARRHHFQQYKNRRDHKRVLLNEPSRWTRYSYPLMTSLAAPLKHMSVRSKGRQIKHIYDWMAHASNLAKGSKTPELAALAATCLLCGGCETQVHINTTCSHPEMLVARASLRRKIEEHFMCLHYQQLPTSQRWMITIMDHIEQHLWDDTTATGDIWNGRWTKLQLETILGDYSAIHVPEKDFLRTKIWLQSTTRLLLSTQLTLYATRTKLIKLLGSPTTDGNLHQLDIPRKSTLRNQTLLEAWGSHYSRFDRRRIKPPEIQLWTIATPVIPTFRQLTHSQRTILRRAPISMTRTTANLKKRKSKTSRTFSKWNRATNTKSLQKEDHRSTKLKLRK